MKKTQLIISMVAIFVAIAMVLMGNVAGGILCISLVAAILNTPRARFCLVTLSVPEILADVLDAFKVETPALFGPGGFGVDFSSKTAVLGDKITAKIASVPTVGNYDRANGGFKAASQDVTTLITDVPVTLDQFKIVTVNITWLTQLASRIQLYQEAIRNYGYALGKYVVDTALATITPANFSNSIPVALANVNLDTLDLSVRDQCNTQKMANLGRFSLVSTAFASKFGSDDRVRSSFVFNQRNGDRGYRMWNNIGGFGVVQEYTDMPAAGNLIGYAGDKRGIAVATRGIEFSNVAGQLGIPQVMQFHSISDDETGINMTGAAWQEAGTGDVYVSAGILFGVSAGKQGGANGSICDNAGVRIVTP